jgi:hypothetical protein
MANLDLTTVIVVGALVGLFFVALGYAQMVWLARRREAREPGPLQVSSPLSTWSFWLLVLFAGVLLLRSITSSALPERPAFLVGEDLFSVRPRPGLVAKFETSGVNVHRDDLLLRFTGQDGVEAQLAVESRRKMLESELEIERARPLELDNELVRRADAARVALRECEQRQKQLISERDSITREMTQQRLAIANRRFRIEQDHQTAERELGPLQASRETERNALKSQEALLQQGLLSQVEAARGRDALAELEGRVGQLEDHREILARERQEVANLRALSERAFAQQLHDRSTEMEKVAGEIEAGRKVLELAAGALEQDRPRAAAQRDKRLRQIETQIEECDSLLNGQGRQLTVRAPWDGRIAFREPSPSSPPSDNGPLLVLVRPGKITAAVHLEPGEADATDSDLRAEIQIFPSSPGAFELGVKEGLLLGRILQRTLLQGGSGELTVALDPPERVVRQLAMGGTVPVRVQLRRGIASSGSFLAGLASGGLAFALAIVGALRRRFLRPAGSPPPDPHAGRGDGVQPTVPVSPTAPQAGPVLTGALQEASPGVADELAIVLGICSGLRQRLLGNSPAQRRSLLASDQGGASPSSGAPLEIPALAWHSPQIALPSAHHEDALLETAAAQGELPYLRDLGEKLRMQVEGGVLSSGLVRQVGDVLTRGGYKASAMVSAGFGAIGDPESIERAAFGLLATARPGNLGEATRDCAEFLRVMRAIASERMNGALDRLRAALISAALDAARRGGTSSEMAGNAVKPLVEA